MTAPVKTSSKSTSEEIAMTAPVLMDSSSSKKMTMSFSMPSKYDLQTLPKPNDPRVTLAEMPTQYVAALRFSGLRGEDKKQHLGLELMNWVEARSDYRALTAPSFAGYDPPWTLPFFRRNEMLVPLEKTQNSPSSQALEGGHRALKTACQPNG